MEEIFEEEEYIEQLYSVYVKVDEYDNVVEINSDAFIQDFVGWIKIDEGLGDKYVHAQHNYLAKPLIDDDGNYNYKLEDVKK